MTGPLKRGGGDKGPAMKEKQTTLLKILLPLKNKSYFTFDNLSKYGHITLKFAAVGIFTGLLQYFTKIGLFQSKNWGRKKIVKIRFRLSKD